MSMPDQTGAERPVVAFNIIARRRIPELDRLVAALLAMDGPEPREIFVAVETPGTTSPTPTTDADGVHWIAIPARHGIAYNRNRAFDGVTAPLVISVDDDCLPKPGWLDAMLGAFDDPSVDATVGSIELPPAGYVGDSISALGFPAGGSAGYETMFPVDPDGTTYNISSGNSGMRSDVLRQLGGWDNSMSWCGEDTELAYRFGEAGRRIVFVPGATIVHPARAKIGEFVKWSWVRGRAKAQLARKVPVSGFISNRLKSFGRILSANARDPKILLIAPLLATSILAQQAGFVAEWLFPRQVPSD